AAPPRRRVRVVRRLPQGDRASAPAAGHRPARHAHGRLSAPPRRRPLSLGRDSVISPSLPSGDAGHADMSERHRELMQSAIARAAAAIDALARGDGPAYREALGAIVADFEQRADHLTGVAFCDTAAMLETLAAPRGVAVRPASALLPPVA